MKSVKHKIIFLGTPEFATVILKTLIKSKFQPIAVITAPDNPIGRKQVRTPSPVKRAARKNHIDVFQPRSLKNNPEIIDQLMNIKPDICILAAYGLILPQEILNIPQYGCLNVHPSLLPKYRGASPIQAAILNRDKTTGITIIKMDEKVDHGSILAQQEFKMTPTPLSFLEAGRSEESQNIVSHQITYPKLSKKLAELGGELLIKILPKYLKGKIRPTSQNHAKATFTTRITRQDGKIDWSKSAQCIEAMTRAYYPWPGAFATLKINPRSRPSVSPLGVEHSISRHGRKENKLLKIIKADILNIKHDKRPGTVFLTGKKQLAVACGKEVLLLEEVQLEGKKPMSGKDFYNGYQTIVGVILR